jgi:hypothetical protein
MKTPFAFLSSWCRRGALRALPTSLASATFAVCLGLSAWLPAPAHAGKPSSGVSVQASVPAKLRTGEAFTLKLRVGKVTAAEGASLEVREPASGKLVFSTRLNAGETRNLDVPYTATRDGMQYLDVITRQGQRSSVQSVALAVGSGAVELKSEGKPLTTPSGEKVISLPAKP